MISKLWAIASNTFIESVRQPIYGILLWVGVGLLILNPGIAAFSLESGGDNKIMKDVGLSTLLMYGMLISVFTATGVITREIESFTVLTVVSKPVSRPLFLLGKFLGVGLAILLGYFALSLVLIMTAEHGVMETTADKRDWPVIVLGVLSVLIGLTVAGFGNFTYGWHFSSTLTAVAVPLATLATAASLVLDDSWSLAPIAVESAGKMLQLIYAIICVFMAVAILTAFAVAISTRFSQVVTLALCAGLMVLGLLSDYYFGRRIDEGLPYSLLARVVPNFQFFWLGDAITQDLTVAVMHVVRVSAYSLAFCGALLALGVAMFQTREVG